MKKLLLLLFSLMLSFNSYGEWTEFPPYDSEERYFIDFDNLQERSDVVLLERNELTELLGTQQLR